MSAAARALSSRAPSRASFARASRARARGPASAVVVPRASSDDDGASPFDFSTLAKRVDRLKREEASGATGTMQVIVLDATLPGQRLGLRFDAKDTKRRLNAGTALGPLAEVGDTFLMLGQAPSSGQILPLGTEVTLTRVEPFPDGSGDVEVELRGVRRVRIDGQPFNENGIAMAKVTFMTWAPEDTPATPDDVGAGSIRGDHPAASASTRGSSTESEGEGGVDRDGRSAAEECEMLSEALAPLVEEWKTLVRDGGFERRKDQLELIASHIGPMPPADEAARRAVWVAALINPIPALGVAYEIRPALLMARDTRGMLKVATDGITLSIENLRSQIRGGRA